MTIFNLEDQGKWFELEGGGRLQLRNVSREVYADIRKKTIRKKVDFKKVEGTPARFDYEEVNEDLSNELFWDYVIVAWENFFDASNNPIPCNKQNKMLLISKSITFAKYVNECLKVLTESELEEQKAQEKN